VKPSPEKDETESKTTRENKRRRTTDDFLLANISSSVSTKARTDVSLFCISNNKKLFKVFWGANRKDVINLTTPTTKKNKDMKEAFYLFFASCHMQRENLKVTHAKKRRGVIKSRGGYFFFRIILGRDFASSSAFKREKEISLQPPHETRLKNWTHPTSRYHI
jgi:hypothetical protein